MSVRVERHGGLGTGKTTGLVLDAVKYHLRYPDNSIYANIPIKLPNFKPIDSARVLFEINENAFIGLDELWHIADSHRSQSVGNKVMSMLSLRSRKKGWMVSYTQQHWMQTDKRIRFITDLWGEPILYEDEALLVTDWYLLDGTFIDQTCYEVDWVFKFFDSYDDPLTLSISDLEAEYAKWKKKNTGRYY